MRPFSDVVVLTSETINEPVSEDLMLCRDLEAEGLRPSLESWESFEPDPKRMASILFRTTWGYHENISDFKKLLKKIQQHPKLMVWNSIETIRWNLNKNYLLQLQKAGLPIVPTELIDVGDEIDFDTLFDSFETEELVVKPAIGAGARDLFRLERGESMDEIRSRLDPIKGQSILIQPFIESLPTEGELSLILISGNLTHSVLKLPAKDDFRVQAEYGGKEQETPTPQEALRLATRCLDQFDEAPLIARVDLVRSRNDHFLLMELELIEPLLFMELEPKASKAIAAEISKQL